MNIEWSHCFKEGQILIEQDKDPEHFSTNINYELLSQVRDLVKKLQKIDICEMAKDVGIYYGSCPDILAEDLRIRHMSPTFYSTTAAGAEGKL
jgi:hypothetical protein